MSGTTSPVRNGGVFFMERDMPLFIWILDLKPMAQIIHAEQLNGSGEQKLQCVQKHTITEKEAELGVSMLSRLYPYKGEQS